MKAAIDFVDQGYRGFAKMRNPHGKNVAQKADLGALLGGSFGSGTTVEVLLASSRMRILLAVVTALFAPLAIWGSVWMNRLAFGKALDALRRNIQAWEKI